jgi:GxxExxY protein
LRFEPVNAKPQVSFPVCYKGRYVGEYVADLVVEERVIVELKCVDRLGNEHLAQCINYLKASGLSVALLINFHRPKVEWKRILLDQ